MKLQVVLVYLCLMSMSACAGDWKPAALCEPPPRKGPSAAYLKKMQRLKDLEKEVVEQKRRIQELEDLNQVLPIEKTVVVEKEQPVRKNAFTLLGGVAHTRLETSLTTTTNPVLANVRNEFNARTVRELDLGLMYQRDFDRIRGSVAATIRGTVLLGIGWVF